MNGWFAVARISCSVSARLIFLRSIISRFDRTAGRRVRVYEVGGVEGNVRIRGWVREERELALRESRQWEGGSTFHCKEFI
jgi:hypothetical protein